MVLRWTFGQLRERADSGLLVTCLSASCMYTVMKQQALQRKRLRRILSVEWVKPELPATPDEGIVSALLSAPDSGTVPQDQRGSAVWSLFFVSSPCR